MMGSNLITSQILPVDTALLTVLSLFTLLIVFVSDFAAYNGSARVFDQAVADSEFKLEGLIADPKGNINAYHTLARLHVWRMTMSLVGARLAIVALGIIYFQNNIRANTLPLFDYAWSMQAAPLGVMITQLALIIAAVVFVLEPVWRVRLTTAYGLSEVTRYNPDAEPIFSGRGFWLTAGYWGGLYAAYLLMMLLPWYLISQNPLLTLGDTLFIIVVLGVLIVALVQYNQRVTRWFIQQAVENCANFASLMERQTQARTEQAAQVRVPQDQPFTFWQRIFAWKGLFWLIRSGNPVIVMDTRRLVSAKVFATLRTWSLQTFTRLTVIGLVFGLGLTLFSYYQAVRYASTPNYYPSTYSTPYYHLYTSFTAIAIGLGIIGIFASGFLDFNSITAAHNTINRDMVTGRWDLLRMTMLPESQLIMGKHAVTQVRAWKMLSAVMGMRILALVIGGILAVLPAPYEGGLSGLESLIRNFNNDFLLTLFTVGVVLWTVVIYLLEPLWRHHSMTAMGLAVSSDKSTLGGLLTGFAAIFGVWISQGFTLFVFSWIVSLINSVLWAANYNTLYSNGFDYDTFMRLQTIITGVSALLFGVVVYAYYRVLRNSSLRQVMRRAFRA
jgi:hypothetical protein